MEPRRLDIDGRRFRDSAGREVTFRGINVAGDAKSPSRPNIPSHISQGFFEGDTVSFVDRPFTVDQAHTHFTRLKQWGYNSIRYVFTWEAIEHAGPGKYDEEWIQHTITILRIAKQYGFHVVLDPHQDVWSRFSGGSGAPMWTLYACGLNPQAFGVTEAAMVHNTYHDPAAYPPMIWATNYTRLACQVMFTLFFGGRDYAPKAIIDGKNIQDYLQEHFIAACKHFAKRIHEAGDLENDPVIGWETLNEPNRGLIAWHDLSVIPPELKYRKGTSPTAWQAMLLGSGRPCEVETWEFGRLGPYKTGTTLVDPKGQSAWLPKTYDDTYYGWKRDPGWKLGECLWAQHGVWDPSKDILLKQDYFAKYPGTGELIDYVFFTNHYFMQFYRQFRDAIRSVHRDAIIFLQPPVLELPPLLKETKDNDSRIVYAPHYYDGITLIRKSWSSLWNVDVFGVLRGRYSNPVFAIKIGETAIRNCLRDQLSAIRQEGLEYMGDHPCVLSEIGIPYDMNEKSAYKTGDYTSQCHAMDANHFAIEGSGMNGFMLWLYMSENNHQWGDQWNGEDLSIYSVDDMPLPLSTSATGLLSASSDSLNFPSSMQKGPMTSSSSVTPSTLKADLRTPSMASQPSSDDPELSNSPGLRAAEAYVRPSPIATAGDVLSYGFDLRSCLFTLSLTAPTSTEEDNPTEIFLPEFHFPSDRTVVEVSGGRWTISLDDVNGARLQKLRWWHAEGEQSMSVKGLVRRFGKVTETDEEDGYLGQYWPNNCSIM